MPRCQKESPCPSGALTHLPRVTLVKRGGSCGLTGPTCLLPAARCLKKEGAYDGTCAEEALSPLFKSERLERKRVISV